MIVHQLCLPFGLIGAVLLSLSVRPVAAQSVNVEAAKKEGKLVAYGTIVPQVMDPVHRGFEQKYGIKIEYWRASATQVVERALSEWQAGRPGFDLIFAIHGAQLLLKKHGIFGRYTPPSADKFPPDFKDKDGMLVAWRHTPVGILYNTKLVKPGDQPTTLDDLLQPKWKGKIVIPDASRHTSTAQFLVSLKKIKGGLAGLCESAGASGTAA
jgi:iron(III) transport system substrate-binding protein